MSNPTPTPRSGRGARIAVASVVTALALGGVAAGGGTAYALTTPAQPKPPTVQQVDARAAASMVQLGIQWSGYIAYINTDGDYVWTDQPVEASFICSGWFVDTTGDIVTAGHCVTPKGAKEKLIDAYVGQLQEQGEVDDAWIDANLAWAERTWKVENATGGSTPDRKVVAYQSDRVKGAVLKSVTPASVIAYRSPDDEDAALLNVDAVRTPAMPIAAASPRTGQAVTAIGFPGSVQEVVRYDTLAASFKTGTISSRQVNDNGVAKLEVNADISGGMSGGPTVDRLGNVVGLNSFTINGEQENFNFITDTVSLRKFLQREGIAMAKPLTPPAKADGTLHALTLVAAGVLALIVLGLGGLWIALAARRGRRIDPAAPAVAATPVLPTSPVQPLAVQPVGLTGPALEQHLAARPDTAPVPAVQHAAGFGTVPQLLQDSICDLGHGSPAGSAFCSTCGASLGVRQAEEAALV